MLDKTRDVWPPDYVQIIAERKRRLFWMKARCQMGRRIGVLGYYETRPIEFIEHWCDTFDPRNVAKGEPTRVPFILFPRQKDLVEFLLACVKGEENGLIEKCRDMGATWLCAAFSVWLFLFWPGASIGWGSRKELLVDRVGDPDSIFEKMRIIINHLPPELRPAGFSADNNMTYMRFINPENGATITGEAGDNIGRGGRKLIYFKDESAHYEHPEKIEAALTDNTRVQIDISSVNGIGNVFYRRRQAGAEWEVGKPVVKGRTNIFVMDWRDHPAKTEKWYEDRKQKSIDDGLEHIFFQEVERNYSASVQGTIIPADWVKSAIDAHEVIDIAGFEKGGWCAALDVADSDNTFNGDTNALAKRKGVVLKYIEEWGERDTGTTTRRAIEACQLTVPIDLQYDSIGVGSGVKAETNRLKDDGLLPKHIRLVPWSAGAGVIEPEGRVVPNDLASPLNKDFYSNLKAQAWWSLRRRFEKTHRARVEGIKYNADEMISLSSRDLGARLRKLQEELSQPTADRNGRMQKMVVDKQPEGTRSPNLADAVVMCFFPLQPGYDDSLDWV